MGGVEDGFLSLLDEDRIKRGTLLQCCNVQVGMELLFSIKSRPSQSKDCVHLRQLSSSSKSPPNPSNVNFMGKALPVSPADYFSSHLAMCREVKFQSNIHTIANRRTSRHSSHESPKRTKKRRRTTLSCITCHQRKVRCDRKLPCTSCVGYGTKDICSFYVDALR